MMMEKIEDLTHTNELWGEIVFDESALKVIPYGNTESEYSMEYSRFKDFYILKHYCVFGDKRKIEKGLTQETIIIDKTVLTEADKMCIRDSPFTSIFFLNTKPISRMFRRQYHFLFGERDMCINLGRSNRTVS